MGKLSNSYSALKKSGHKMSAGGECSACGGRCKYDEGGDVSPSPSPSMDSDKAKEVKDSFNSQSDDSWKNLKAAVGFAKGGEVGSHKENHAYNYDSMHDQKGVHEVIPRYDKEKGMKYGESTANPGWSKSFGSKKEKHEKVLGELKSMPNPKLKGLAEGGEVDPDNDGDADLHEGVMNEFMDAVHSKDHKSALGALKALIMSVKGSDND